MALTEAQINQVARVLGVTKRYLNAHIDSLGDDFSAQDETDIETELARWDDGAGTDFTKIHPNVKNFGAEINPADLKADIRRNIAVLLDFDVQINTSVGTLQIGL